jgi:hypothetical protein
MNFALALTSTALLSLVPLLLSRYPRFLIPGMAVKGPRGGKISQFMAHHLFADEDGEKFLPVMNTNGNANHLGQDGGASRPRFDNFPPLFLSDLPQQTFVDKGTLLN